MRKFLLPVLFTISCLAAQAQSADNAPWCPPGATWIYQHVAMQNENYYVFRYTGDTVIQGLTSKVMTVTNVVFGYAGPNGQGAYSSAAYRGSEYYRQSGDSIFWWTGSDFQLICRLHPQAGDSWVVRNPRDVCSLSTQFPAQDTIKVRALQKDTINGRIYDVATLRSDSAYFILGYTYTPFGNFSGRIRSGIGSLETPYPLLNMEKCAAMAGTSITDAGRFYALICYSDDIRGSVPMNPAPGRSCSGILALTTAVSSISAHKLVWTVGPNPVRNELRVYGTGSRAQYTLRNTDGRSLATGTLQNGTLDVSRLAPGIYLLEVYEKQRRAVLKVLKQ